MIAEILQDVAAIHEVKVSDIRGRSRQRQPARARHAAIWVLSRVSTLTQERIAESVGLTDHTTVTYAIRKIETEIARDPGYADQLYSIVERYRHSQPKITIRRHQTIEWLANLYVDCYAPGVVLSC